eukprot:TRINITY_DN5795_c2_g1_i1.p1 TRINITY_DN5795_c2_g1~~TRINITY_DN5795_c2_g1_i1.p1  ORF type:complete len:867 (+),score=256.58 TRINITY_DN5795_c2_g1_i1:83-2602(+)
MSKPGGSGGQPEPSGQKAEISTLHMLAAPPDGERERWSGRCVFILAAMGSAIGLGNFWRFPFLVYRYGGGTFLIPYVISLLVIGIPMLLLELGLGQKMQAGDVKAFGRIHSRLRGVGMASVFASFIVVTYYCVIIAWTAVYFVESFLPDQPWRPWGNSSNAADAGAARPGGQPCAVRPEWHFYHELLGLWNESCGAVGGAKPHGWGDSAEQNTNQIGALAAVWAIVCASVLYGVRTASWVVRVSMPLPFLLALILFFRAVTLDGAGDGVHAYLGKWDWDLLREPEMWTDAMGQTFFTLSVCFGVMTSYGSYRPREAPIMGNVFVVAIGNCLFSFFCGFIVFGILGYMAFKQEEDCMADMRLRTGTANATLCHVPVEEVVQGGIPLVFIVFPTALATMGTSGHFFAVLTFLTLFTLGWDSAFSLLEAITTVILDSEFAGKSTRARINSLCRRRVAAPLVTVTVSLAAFGGGLAFTPDTGLYWLDLVDHYATNYTMIIDGVLQAVGVGWVWGYRRAAKTVGSASALAFAAGYGVASAAFVAIAASAALELAPCETAPGGAEQCYTGGELAIAWGAFAVILIPSWLYSFLRSPPHMTVDEWFAAVGFAGPAQLLDYAEACGGVGRGHRAVDFFTRLWRLWFSFSIQYIAPVLLTVLVVLRFKKDIDQPYGGYQRWMQNTCWVGVACTIALFLFFLFPCMEGGFGDDEEDGVVSLHSRGPPKQQLSQAGAWEMLRKASYAPQPTQPSQPTEVARPTPSTQPLQPQQPPAAGAAEGSTPQPQQPMLYDGIVRKPSRRGSVKKPPKVLPGVESLIGARPPTADEQGSPHPQSPPRGATGGYEALV